ncbi:response regulator [Qipengyuania sp. MTN3-11]|uniref:response regulator n=1 Tax=Qipengyuania sp. MTN3-11 TaxID=3056557 RepID=UPI0036F44E21
MARIIYAEDDPLVGDLVKATLIDAGHAVGVVQTGREAVDVVRFRRPDLLILDITMPEMSGSEALDLIRRDPGLYDLPVLMLTGRRGQTDEDIALKAGASEYLRKPFDCDRLVVLVESMLAQARRYADRSDTRSI